jgi:hypothetical protein
MPPRHGHGAFAAQPKQQKRGGGGPKQQPQHIHQPTVSPAVKALQTLISHVQNPPPKSASQECFCQSRTHPLSLYTPQCTSCGLVLCSLNPPFHPCPSASCGAPLLADHARRTLVDQLSAQVAQAIADEEGARRREDEARARAADAFPELGGGSAGASASASRQPRVVAAAAMAGNYTTQTQMQTQTQIQVPQQQQQFHKVLSLSGKGKVTATYTRISPSLSSTSLHAKAKEDKEVCVPPPPEGPEYLHLAPAELKAKTRLYENLRGEGPVYVPLPREENAQSDAREGPGRRRRPQNKRKKKQGKENQPQLPQLLDADGPSSHS